MITTTILRTMGMIMIIVTAIVLITIMATGITTTRRRIAP
jgi:hypothetical protein